MGHTGNLGRDNSNLSGITIGECHYNHGNHMGGTAFFSEQSSLCGCHVMQFLSEGRVVDVVDGKVTRFPTNRRICFLDPGINDGHCFESRVFMKFKIV
jgi:hypothetical protein